MLEHLRAYIQTVLTVLLLAVVVDLLVPPRSGRYVRLVMGLVLALAVLGPVLEILGSDLEGALRRWDIGQPVAPAAGHGPLADPGNRLWEHALSAQATRYAEAVLVEMGLDGLWAAGAVVSVLPGAGEPVISRLEVVLTRRSRPGGTVDPVNVSLSQTGAEASDDDERELFRRLLLARTGLDPDTVTVLWQGGS